MAAAPISRDHSCDHSLVVVLGLLAPRERLGRARDALPVRGRRRARERDDGGQERVPDLVRGRVRVRVGVRVGVGVRTKVWLGLGLVRDLRAEIEQVEVERGLCKAKPKRVSSRAIPAWGLPRVRFEISVAYSDAQHPRGTEREARGVGHLVRVRVGVGVGVGVGAWG